MSFDVVIPVGPNDLQVIQKQIEFTKKNVVDYRKIYLICCDPTLKIEECETINEEIFPFNMDTVSTIHGKNSHNGWYLQQLLKMYAGLVIPNISHRYLVIDCDTFFLKPTTFIENDICLYNYGTEYHVPYFEHMQKMNEDFTKIDHQKSGICHHMMFETIYMKEIITIIEQKHCDSFYNVFLKCVSPSHILGSGASEYELYFNYVLKHYANKIKLRPLAWKNVSHLSNSSENDYESCHWHMRVNTYQ